MSSHLIFLIYLILITEESSKTMFWKNLWESIGIAWRYEVPYHPQHQVIVNVFNRTSKFLQPQQKTFKKFEESYNDFVIYYNDREHSTTKVTTFRAIMNVENKDLI